MNLLSSVIFPSNLNTGDDKMDSWAHLGLGICQRDVNERQQSKRVCNIDKKMINMWENKI